MLEKMHTSATEEKLSLQLVLVTALTWFIFPLMVKQLNPQAFLTGFAVCVFIMLIGIAKTSTRNELVLQPIHKAMLACWIGYLLSLLLSSLASASIYSLSQWCIVFAKFAFFAALLLYINMQFIVAALRLYSNLMVITVLFALLAVVAVANGFHPIATVDLGGRPASVYWGAYYVLNTSICMPAPIFRIQGLSEEPGTYAFALLPAFFWFLIAEKSYVRSTVIAAGLVLSMSLGVGLFLLLLAPVLMRKILTDRKLRAIFLSVILGIGVLYFVSGSCSRNYLNTMDAAELGRLAQLPTSSVNRSENQSVIESSLSTSPLGKVQSFQERRNGLLKAYDYLTDHMMGTGAALGMSTVKSSISVGYAVAALEAGIVGGALYLCLFTAMGWLALKAIVTSSNGSFDDQVKIVVALSVCTVLVMGAQRIQPDLSLWHMWIYAMWFYLMQRQVTGSSVVTDQRV